MTTAQYVTVILDRYDGAGNPVVQGSAVWSPSQDLPDPADMMLVGQGPVPAVFRAGSLPTVKLIANDSIGPQQEDGTPGWTWNLAYDGVPGSPAPASYYILTTGGSTQYLSELAPTPAAQPGQQYVPLPSTPPSSAAQVLGLSSDSPLATEWVDQTGGGGGGSGTVTTVSVATANGFAGTVANPTTTPAVTLKTTANGILKGNSTTGVVSAATPGTDYVTPTGSGATLTGITAAQVGADASGAAATAQTNAETFATSAVATETSRAEAAEALLAPKASPTFTGTVTVPATVNATDAAQKQYVDSVAAGLDAKPSVTALAASNITLSGTQTIDGVAVTAGERVLAVGQSTASQNGLWVAAAGSWTRPADFASGSSQLGAFAFTEAGTAYGSSGWVLVGASAVTVDTSAQTWTQFSGAGEVNAGTGLTKTGNTISVTPSTYDAFGAAATAQSNAETFATAAVATETSRAEAAEALALPLAGGTMSGAIAMGSHKVTGLTNGSAAQDAAAFGQIPTALPPNGSASGDLSGSYPAPTVAKVNSAALPLSKTIVGTNGSGQIVDASSATLANNTSGNAATATNLAGAAAFPAAVSPKVSTLTQSGGTVAVNQALANVYRLVLTASGWTLSNPTGFTDGEPIRVRLIQDGTGGRTISYGTAWDFGAAGAPTLSTGPNKVDYLVGEWSADANAGAGAVAVSAALGF